MSLLPPLIVCLTVRKQGMSCDKVLFFAFLAAVLLLHIGTNVLNDYHDHCSGVDDSTAPGPSGVIQQRKVAPLFMLYSGILYFVLAIAVSIPILLARPIVLLPGIPAVIAAYFYTSHHFSLKYHRLGEVAVFMLFGPLLFIAATLSFTHASWVLMLLVSLPFGLYAAAVLFVNNTRDCTRDHQAGIKTIPMLFSSTVNRIVFMLLFLTSLLLLNLFPRYGANGGMWLLLTGSLLAAAVIVPLSMRRNIDRLPPLAAFLLLPLTLLYMLRILLE